MQYLFLFVNIVQKFFQLRFLNSLYIAEKSRKEEVEKPLHELRRERVAWHQKTIRILAWHQKRREVRK